MLGWFSRGKRYRDAVKKELVEEWGIAWDSVSVCVCVWERERERNMKKFIYI